MSFFDQSVYDPSLWPAILQRLANGERFGIKVGYDDAGNYNPEVICSTERELMDQVYEAFRYVFTRDQKHLIWGMNGHINPIREPATQYCDGLVFWTTRREFLDCLDQYTIERVFSFLTHFRYGWEVRPLNSVILTS